jgi:hypothetical protein
MDVHGAKLVRTLFTNATELERGAAYHRMRLTCQSHQLIQNVRRLWKRGNGMRLKLAGAETALRSSISGIVDAYWLTS